MIDEAEVAADLARLSDEELIERTLKSAEKLRRDARGSSWWLARYVLELKRRGLLPKPPPIDPDNSLISYPKYYVSWGPIVAIGFFVLLLLVWSKP